MSVTTNTDHDEAQDILDALRKIQDSPELRDEAKSNPDSVLNRLHLSGVARQAVAFAITGLIVGPGVAQLVHKSNFWS